MLERNGKLRANGVVNSASIAVPREAVFSMKERKYLRVCTV